jgi:hypothetical protein
VAVLNKPGSRSHQLTGDSQHAVIVSTFLDRIETTEIDALGIPRTIERGIGEGSAGASAMTAPADTGRTSWGSDVGIPGLVRILPMPGHENASITVAELDDGTYRTLVKEDDGSTRVTGILARWPNMPAVSGAWAISASTGDRIAIFSVKQVTPARCCCHC